METTPLEPKPARVRKPFSRYALATFLASLGCWLWGANATYQVVWFSTPDEVLAFTGDVINNGIRIAWLFLVVWVVCVYFLRSSPSKRSKMKLAIARGAVICSALTLVVTTAYGLYRLHPDSRVDSTFEQYKGAIPGLDQATPVPFSGNGGSWRGEELASALPAREVCNALEAQYGATESFYFSEDLPAQESQEWNYTLKVSVPVLNYCYLKVRTKDLDVQMAVYENSKQTYVNLDVDLGTRFP